MTDPGSNPGGGTFLQAAFLVVEQDHLWFGNRNASGRIAQMVEHGSNKPRVGGSSPSVTTLLHHIDIPRWRPRGLGGLPLAHFGRASGCSPEGSWFDSSRVDLF